MEEVFGQKFFYWRAEGGDSGSAFIIRTKNKMAVGELKNLLEEVKKETKSQVVSVISKPYKGIAGIRRSYLEAQQLFELARASGTGTFMEAENGIEEKASPEGQEARDKQIVKAVRKNSAKELKEAFVQFIYGLPDQEEQQRQYMHRVMLKTEIMLQASYGMTEDIKEKFQQFYNNLKSLNAARTVDVCYKILCDVIEERQRVSRQDETRLFEGYLAEAAAYIDEHLQDEELSVVSVAAHVYLNPVYFGRVFKNTFQMTFKQYLLQKRMEKAKELLEMGRGSIGDICEAVGIHNPSYFSHLFKQYTGKLPSEYKKEYK